MTPWSFAPRYITRTCLSLKNISKPMRPPWRRRFGDVILRGDLGAWQFHLKTRHAKLLPVVQHPLTSELLGAAKQ